MPPIKGESSEPTVPKKKKKNTALKGIALQAICDKGTGIFAKGLRAARYLGEVDVECAFAVWWKDEEECVALRGWLAEGFCEGAVRLYDAKRFELQAFNSYDARHGHNFAAGVRLLFKVGPSYEEKLIAKQQRNVEALAQYVSRLQDQLAVPAPASIWFVSSNGEIQKTLPKDPAYIKALLEARKK